jgi:hypothetical protein
MSAVLTATMATSAAVNPITACCGRMRRHRRSENSRRRRPPIRLQPEARFRHGHSTDNPSPPKPRETPQLRSLD